MLCVSYFGKAPHTNVIAINFNSVFYVARELYRKLPLAGTILSFEETRFSLDSVMRAELWKFIVQFLPG